MPDQFSEVTSMSWFSRITSSIKGILGGFFLIVISCFLLSWNEGRAVKTAASLDEGKSIVIHISSTRVDPANEGKLVHVTGIATTDDKLTDPEFNLSVNAIKLDRRVSVYEWKESNSSTTNTNIGGGTTTATNYTYSKEWADGLINSGSFKHKEGHENPSSIPYTSKYLTVQNVKLDAFNLPGSLIGKINNFETYDISNANLNPTNKNLMPYDGGYYLGSSSDPQVGDLKISFKIVKPTVSVSLIARQINNTFEPYYTKNGRSIEILANGYADADSMFQNEKTKNSILTWVLRAVGFTLMFFGFSALFAPLTVLAEVLPFLGDIVGMGTGMVALVLAMVVWLATVSIAWFAYRPLLSIILVVVGVGAVAAIILLKPKTAPQKNN